MNRLVAMGLNSLLFSHHGGGGAKAALRSINPVKLRKP